MEGRRVFVAFLPREGDDFNDLLLREGADAVRAAVESATEIERKRDGAVSWNASLLRSRDGKILPILANAISALRNAPEWDGVLWHDEFATRTVARRPLPWMPGAERWTDTSWSDRDDYLVTEWLQRHGVRVPASISGQAVETVARDRLFHPVREYLDSTLRRIDNLLDQTSESVQGVRLLVVGGMPTDKVARSHHGSWNQGHGLNAHWIRVSRLVVVHRVSLALSDPSDFLHFLPGVFHGNPSSRKYDTYACTF